MPARITRAEKAHLDLNFWVRPNGKSNADDRRLAPHKPVGGEPSIGIPRQGLSPVHLPRLQPIVSDSRGSSTFSTGHLNHESATPIPKERMPLVHYENRASLFAQLEVEISTRISSPTADALRELLDWAQSTTQSD
jgi:hypothetical protein